MARLQVALDFLELKRALKVAEEAVDGGADLLEAGTPLIKSEGLDAVRQLRGRFPAIPIVADLKTMDAGRVEVECAAKAGASIVTVLAAAADSTIRECIEAANNYGVEIAVDLIGVSDPEARARQAAEWGAHLIDIHSGIDEQMSGSDPFARLRAVRSAVETPLAIAGGINSETAAQAVEAGADVVIVGGAVIKATDVAGATRAIKESMDTGKAVESDLFKRRGFDEIVDLLMQVSTANLTDAMHRHGSIAGLHPLSPGMKCAGPVVTVRTVPGDYAKPVEAIDAAGPGDVILIEAGGAPPALWGELATESALQKKVAGVVIYGAIRDTAAIRALKFPAFASAIHPAAGEPKGYGEIDVPVTIGGVTVRPGDFLLADDDGVVTIGRDKVVESANRAMDQLERENRLREEIRAGSTLAEVAELERWEVKR